jgi:hypothetical protein
MRFAKYLWIDCETFSLDPTIASVRELAYVAEINGKQIGEIQSYKVQPVFHKEDLLYGHMGIDEFCKSYNKKFHPMDPDRLVTFGFKENAPLFVHSKAALTFNVPPPQVVNPADWVIGKDLVSAHKALMALIDYLIANDSVQGRWVLAGHNVKYDFDVLTYWAKRLLGENESKLLLDKINKYIFLDTLSLCRWMQYSGQLTTDKANLGNVAEELGIDTSNMHSALADVYACREIAYRLLKKEKDQDVS